MESIDINLRHFTTKTRRDFSLVFLRELRVFVVCNIFKLMRMSRVGRVSDSVTRQIEVS